MNIINFILESLDYFDDKYALISSAILALIIFFIIEYIRKPRISLILQSNPMFFNFNLFNSDNYKFQLTYITGWYDNFLFKYSLSNTKIFAKIYNKNSKNVLFHFQLKPDQNPNVSEEKDVPSALNSINLERGGNELFPFILYLNTSSEDSKKWLLFEVWSVFLQQNRQYFFIQDGDYDVCISVKSDQFIKHYWFELSLNSNQQIQTKKVMLNRMSFLRKLCRNL